MTKHSLLILFFCSAVFIFWGLLISAQEQRTWSDATGKFKVEAKLHRIEGDKILLEKQDGKISSIPLSKLSKKDQEYVASQKDNPFADEDEASPFANEDHAKSSTGFDIEPKPLTGKNSIVFVGATNTSWNCPPDADTTPDFKERPSAIQFGVGELPSSARTEYNTYPYFADGKHYVLATVSIELSRHSASSRTSRSSANRNKRDGNKSETETNETRLIFCNLENGDTTSESVPQKLTLLDVSPDGTTALFRSSVWGFSDTGTKDILYIADITSQKVNVLNAYTPFDEERFESNRDIKDAFVINKDTVLVSSQNTTLVVFNVKTGRVIWKTERTANTPVLSANRKYCIANGSVLEAATGKSVGKPDIQERSGTYSFSPDGKSIAFTTFDGITFFDAETGKGSEPFFVGNTIGKHIWTSNQFVLAGRGLIDAKTKSLVWEYNPPEFYFGGYTWYLPSSGGRADKTLVPVMLPHPVAATNALKPEWAVAPGKEVALKIDDSVSEKKREIAAHLEKVLKDNGIRIRDNAPITVEASIKKEKETSAFYVTSRGFGPPLMSPFARSGDEGTEIKYIPEVFSVQVKQGDKIYWQTSKTKAPPQSIPLDDIKKSSIQEVVKREMNKIKYADWFLQVTIPKQIPGGNIGHSMISATGITDFKSGIAKPQTVNPVSNPSVNVRERGVSGVRPAETKPEPPQSKPETADEKAVKECFYRYKKAILNDKSTEARECVDNNTIKYYDKLLQWVKTAKKAEVEKLSLMNRMTVLLIRHKIPKEEMPKTGEVLFVYAVENGMVGKDSVSTLEIANVKVLGDFASSKVLSSKDRSEAPFGFQFHRENGKWKIDITSILPFAELLLKNIIKESGMTENEMILQILEAVVGKKPDDSIWNPL